MAVKLPNPLIRTNYLDPSQGNFTTDGNPDSVGYNPQNVLARFGDSSHGESKVDMEQYFRPLERLHGMGAHGAGIGSGLQARAVLGQPNVQVQTGIALDATGKHIYLAVGGQAEIGPTADVPNTPSNLVAVTQQGVALPTANFNGDYFVAVQWWETFDQASYINSNGAVSQFDDTPWLRLLKAADYNPDKHVVLAKVSLDNNSNVTALSYGDAGGLQRTSVSLPTQRVQFKRAVNVAGPGADTQAWGEVRSRESGGLQMTVPNGGDQIELLRDDGQNQGTFTKMSIAADYVATRRADGIEAVIIDSPNGTLKVGNQGLEGDIWVLDDAGNFAVTLDSGPAQVLVGGPGNAGKVRVKNAERTDLITLDGASGDIWFLGRLQDPNHQHNGIGHDLLRWLPELTGGGITALHRHLNSGDATQAHVLWLQAGGSGGNEFDIQTISFTGARNVFAFIALTSINSYGGFDDDDALLAEIYRVDGVDFRQDGWWKGGNPNHLGNDGDDANLRGPVYVGPATTIDFRLRSLNDQQVWAMAVVFPQTA